MILEYREERRLISDVRDIVVVQEVKPVYELIRAAVQGDQVSLVVWYEEAVLPDTRFKRLMSRVLLFAILVIFRL